MVTALTDGGVEIAIVSDFRVDPRPHLDSLGLLHRIASFVLSCEVGTTKPDPLMFESALTKIGASAERCLMVGDNPRPDTGAAMLGITMLILPVRRDPRPPVLERVLSLVL